ncbi:MAG: DNA repair protein RadC [Bacillota bacterium]|nr:DNA repair protein RadC [Bacillota bacterium]
MRGRGATGGCPGAPVAVIKELPVEERPRERLNELGARALSGTELLAVLLGSGSGRGRSALDLAQAILTGLRDEGGGAGNLGGAGEEPALSLLGSIAVHDLLRHPGLGEAKAGRVVAAVELGRRVCGARNQRPVIRSPGDVSKLLGERLRHLDREHFMTVLLDTKNQLLASDLVSVGSLDTSLVHPREVFKAAVRRSASSVILAHNHPSGDPTPSSADIACTSRLAEAGRVLGIMVLDHVIIGHAGYVSLRERGIGGLSAGVQ